MSNIINISDIITEFIKYDCKLCKNIHDDYRQLLPNSIYLYNKEILSFKINVFPKDIYRIFAIPINEIKIIIIGQDPYYNVKNGKIVADGLAFSSDKIEPSLRNIFKEINTTFNNKYNFTHGNLSKWFNNGIFLINLALTVEENKPGSHIKFWRPIILNIINHIRSINECCILLMGKFAQAIVPDLQNKNNIIIAPHPSPLGKNFAGCGCFKEIDKIIKIDWQN